jgi:hypothetical protein
VEDSAAQRIKMEEETQKDGPDAKNVRQDMFHYLMNAKDPVTGGPAQCWAPDTQNPGTTWVPYLPRPVRYLPGQIPYSRYLPELIWVRYSGT